MIEGVGDRGIDFALDAIEALSRGHPQDDHRMRVEHCCYVTPEILARLKRLRRSTARPPASCTTWARPTGRNRGAEAMAHMWPHRSLIDAGVPAPGPFRRHGLPGQPVPRHVVDGQPDVRHRRRSRQEPGGHAGEALHAYTTLGAWSGREETVKGSLEIGKLADVAVLDRDYFTIAADEIRNVQVDMTVLGGQILYER